jgi:GNAT superfamily N-acetyltransferase
LVVDRVLIERVMRAEVAAGFRLARAAVAVDAEGDAGALALGGGVAVSTGTGTYVNRAWGLGITEPVTDDHLDALVAFFAERHEPAALELTPWADPETLPLLGRRGWRLSWFLGTYGRDLASDADPRHGPRDPAIEVAPVTDADRDEWLDTVVDGNEPDGPTERHRARRFAELAWSRADETAYLARRSGRAVGCGSLEIVGGIALLGGAATLPSARRRGVQAALLAARLDVAARSGCDLAVVSADPRGGSARNIQRAGFVPLWTSLLATAT